MFEGRGEVKVYRGDEKDSAAWRATWEALGLLDLPLHLDA
jgi:hypothetical protein